MPRRLSILIITLAMLLPAILVGTWVAYYVAHPNHPTPHSMEMLPRRVGIVAPLPARPKHGDTSFPVIARPRGAIS